MVRKKLLKSNNVIGFDYLPMTMDKVKNIQERLKATQDQQKSYADVRKKDLKLKVSD